MKRLFFLFALAAAAALSPELALAAGSFPFSVDATDVSVGMVLAKVFPTLVEAAGGPGGGGAGDYFADMFATFNGCVLFVGGILSAYAMVAGTMSTAHDGEMLGKKWSSLWVPIRTAVGTALVVPVQSGYCVAQILIMWVALQGVGIANAVWSSFSQAFVSSSGTARPVPPQLSKLATDLLSIQMCKLAVEAVTKDPQNNGQFAQTDIQKFTGGTTERVTSYGSENSGYQRNFCGEYSLHISDGASSEVAAVGAMGEPITNAYTSIPTADPIREAHWTATDALNTAMASLAQQIVANPEGAPANAMPTAIAQYQKTLATAAESYSSTAKQAAEQIKTNSTRDGWMMAGAWYMTMANYINKVNEAVSSAPKSNSLFEVSRASKGDEFKAATDPYALYLKNYVARSSASDGWQSDMKLGVQAANGDKDTSSGLMGKIVNAFAGFDLQTLKEDTRHPILVIKDMGDKLVSWVTVALGAIMGATAAAGVGATVVALVPGLGSSAQVAATALGVVASLVGPFLSLMLAIGLGSGLVLSLYTPMIPFLVYMGAVIGWLILVLESVVGAPLLAIMHLNPAGDGFTGGQQQGYMLILGLAIRPALLVIGYCFAVVLIYPIGMLLNKVFFDVLLLSGADSLWKIFYIFGGSTMYAGVMLTLLHKTFGLIHIIPDKVLRYIGGGGEQLGETAEKMSSGNKAIIAGVSQQASSAGMAGQGSMGALRDSANRRIDRREAKERHKESMTKQAQVEEREKAKDERTTQNQEATLQALQSLAGGGKGGVGGGQKEGGAAGAAKGVADGLKKAGEQGGNSSGEMGGKSAGPQPKE